MRLEAVAPGVIRCAHALGEAIAPPSELIVPWDEADIGALVQNDEGTITVSSTIADGFWKIGIADTGRGIPKKDQKRIFDRFFRAENSSGVPGTGLGLSTVHEIVTRRYKGKIKVDSTLGKGTTFTITLPLVTKGG